MSDKVIYRLAPNQYTHVLDNNTNVSRIEIGPQILIKREHEVIIHAKPIPMVVIPPSFYCHISNPVIRNLESGEVICDKFGQAKLSHGDSEYRFEQDPFPLYPGETIKTAPTKLPVILSNQALRLRAIVDFVNESGETCLAGYEYYFKGPGTYKPRKEEESLNVVTSVNIKKNKALHVKAIQDCIDSTGKTRVAGEEWIIRECGDYLINVNERNVKEVDAIILHDQQAVHLKSTTLHEDQFKNIRKAGDEWIVTNKQIDAYIPDVNEVIVRTIEPVILKSTNYCTILNPVDNQGKFQIGIKKICRGPCSFFLHPYEELDDGVKDVHQLSENDGIILRCIDTMEGRQIGDMWLIRGPLEFVPTEAVEIVHIRKAIALAENEGIYVRNTSTGNVRSVIGGNYMLTEKEELWEKELSTDVTNLLGRNALAERSLKIRDPVSEGQREKHHVVSFRIPHNAACQIYDYKLKKSRVIFGPELAQLEPDEEFTLLSLSGNIPKKPNMRKALCLLLGPDYFEDIFTIETADHARLSLRVSLNWQFALDQKTDEEKKRIFALPDFIGDVCKVVASRIRGTVSSVPFDEFHKHSADIIHLSVFGKDENGIPKDTILFAQNFLMITSLDIISLEPVDQKTRDALQRTVQLAIEITTNAQEASAKHEAIRLQQAAEGRQIRQKLADSIAAEKERKQLIAQKVENMELETCGQAMVDAKSQTQAMKIEKEAAVEQTRLEVESVRIKTESEIEQLKSARQCEIEYIKEKDALEIDRLQKQATIEINKFKEHVAVIGRETLIAIANAGPEMKVKMLQALGLQSALITDGTNPINLFNTANGLIDNIAKKSRINEED